MGVFGNTFGNSLGAKGAVIRRFSNPSAMYVELTFDSVPTADVTKADLLYDKKLAFSMRFDDTYRSAYTNSLAIFMGGSFYADENGIEHDGFRYTDGCGFEMPYVADFACQCSALNSNSNNLYINWEDALEAKNYGYGILPQGCYVTYHPTVTSENGTETYHSPYSEWYNDYVEFRELCYTHLGFKPIVATSDIGYNYWASILDGDTYKAPFFDAGMLFTTTNDNPKEIAGVNKPLDVVNGLNLSEINAESFNSGQPYPCLYHSKRIIKVTELPVSGELYYIYMLPNYTLYRWDGSSFYLTTESLAGSVPLEDIKEKITNAINAPGARGLSIFTHRLDYTISQNDNGGMYLPYYKTEIMGWLDQNYGKNGTDQILMASMNTVAEYVYCRELSTINTYREGNKVILEIIPPVNSDLRRPALTLKLNTNIPVRGVLINNIDRFSQNVLNNNTGIINLEWSSEYYEVANNYMTTAEDIRTQKSVDVATYFMGFVTNPTKLNSLQTRLSNIVVLSSVRYLIDFGRTVYLSDVPPFNNVSSSTTDITSYLPTNISLRDTSNANYGILLDITQAFTTMIYNGKTTGDNSGLYQDYAIQDSFDVTSVSPAVVKIHGLQSGQVVDFKFFASRNSVSGVVTRYTVTNQLDSSTTFTDYSVLDATNNISNTADVINSFANELGEIYVTVSCEGASTVGKLSVMEVITKTVYVTPNFIIDSIVINNGESEALSRESSVEINFIGDATHYMISEDLSFSGATWTSFTGVSGDSIPFTLSEGNEIKNVYLKLKNSEGTETNIASESIILSVDSKIVVSWGNFGTSSQVTLLNGEIINYTNWNKSTGLSSITLKDTDGVTKGIFVRDSNLYPTDSWVKGFGNVGSYNPILSGDTGPYPDLYLAKYMYPQSLNTLGNKALLRFMNFAPGTYLIRILSSTQLVITETNQQKLYFKIGSDTPVQFNYPQAVNNTTIFTELTGTIGGDGILDIYCFNTAPISNYPGVNLIEIFRQS
jgi:hypothetical protein